MKKIMLKIFVVLFYCCSITLLAWEQIIQDSYATLINKFTRPLTALEISGGQLFWTMQNAHRHRASTWIGLTLDVAHAQAMCHMCNMESLKNVVILNPFDLSDLSLDTLNRCEYFDVVLLHDMPSRFYQENTLQTILSLGMYTIIIVPHGQELVVSTDPLLIIPGHQHDLYLFERQKPGLDIARWHQFHAERSSTPRYQVCSDFAQKYMIKRGQKTPWQQGINLMTFIMLRGLRPSDQMIIGQLKQMKKSRHNDLVIGNIIVQGVKITPIDFDDPRRNAKLKKCIKEAIKVFTDERLKNPARVLERYQVALRGH